MADLVRGRWEKRYINSFDDKNSYDERRRAHFAFRSDYAREYVVRHGCPDLEEEEKRAVDAFWGRYGIKVDDYSWWRMYYAVTGIKDPRFVPDDVMGLVIYAYYNDPAYADAWRDKNEFERLLPGMPFPETLGRCRRGRLVADGCIFDRGLEAEPFCKAVFELLGCAGAVIVKDARHSGHGRGVRKYWVTSANDINLILDEWMQSDDFLIQRAIEQHPTMAALNESSVNVVRVVTWRHGGTADVLFSTVRFGVPGSITDMMTGADGKESLGVVAVLPKGQFDDWALDQDGFKLKQVCGVCPAWAEIEGLAKHYALMLDNFDLVGWDFAVDYAGHPICLEYNVQWPGTVYYQFSNGPLMGERTEEVLAFLLDEKNRRNWVPKYMSTECA